MAFNYTTPSLGPYITNQYFEDIPQAGLFDVFRNLGIGGTSPLGGFMRGSFPRYYNAYQSALPYRPELTFRDFLRSDVNPQAEFGALDPRQRGEQPNLFGSRLRWLFNR